MGIGNQSIRSKPISATTLAIFNVTSPGVASTEFSQALPSGVKHLMIRVRGKANLQFTFTATESGSKFITIPENCNWSQTNLDLSSTTLYMQCDQASQVIEIQAWS